MAYLLSPGPLDVAESSWIESIWQQPVRRVFWIHGVPATIRRGGHHHQTCQMVLHCVAGSVTVYVQTPTTDQHFTLSTPGHYLFLDPQDWRLMHYFSPDAVLMVFASKPFETTIYYEQPYRPLNAANLPVGELPQTTRPDTSAG